MLSEKKNIINKKKSILISFFDIYFMIKKVIILPILFFSIKFLEILEILKEIKQDLMN